MMPKASAAADPLAATGMVPTNPLNFLMAAAEMHKGGELQPSAPVPTGKDLQTGKVSHSRKQIRVVK